MTTIASRLQSLPAEKRALLERLLKEKGTVAKTQAATHETAPKQVDRPTLQDAYDVVILGGGLAGLTLAMYIKQLRPETTILVAEKRHHPAPSAAFKVGESTIEGSTHFFGQVLGLIGHLQTKHLVKIGLRYFFPAEQNQDIAQRVEVGPFVNALPNQSYQIDRGIFENMLAEKNLALGTTFLDGCKVKTVSLDGREHIVTLTHDEGEAVVKAQWVVDASGRAGLLKRQLGLAKKVDHNVNSAWFRVNKVVDVEHWSTDEAWRKRLVPGLRRFSTNHLMGDGYWVWLIPLACGSTSIGIVAEEAMHPMKTMNRLELALEWLRTHEPQCAGDFTVENIQDFHTLRHFAHSCKQVFSADERWCITGEAGVFTDPLYSMGSDLISMSNTFIGDLIVRELGGEKIAERADFYNRFYLNFIYPTILQQYQSQYSVMGNTQVMTAKILWDFAWYWATLGPIFLHNKLCDLDLLTALEADLQQFQLLHERTQRFFREWHAQGQESHINAHVDYTKIKFLYQLHCSMSAGLSNEQLKATIRQNIDLLTALAAEFEQRAFGKSTEDAQTDLDPVMMAMLQADLDEAWLSSVSRPSALRKELMAEQASHLVFA